ncbi:hypothetical protein KEM48_006275 [Puccinia striiformis f. sp. tritici PST-130]|nr:hypothetical protein KEM48_006275 [Puccinia striiformis f. sp. tritici PST-130]
MLSSPLCIDFMVLGGTMPIMNFCQSGCITFALVVLMIIFQSAQVSAITVKCDYHFWPRQDLLNWTGSCISKANIHKDHVCPLNECFTRVNGKRAVLWSNQHFGRCHHGKKPKDFLYVLQYFRRDRFVSAQDLDGTWWDCDYSAEAANAEYITCDGCSVSYP